MKFAPRDIFEQILEWSVIPTFDLVIEFEGRGYLVVKRTIAPYKNQWALPGLRMYKDETIDDTIQRIARAEVGLELDVAQKVLLGQYVGKFKTEHNRQDLSTGYYFKVPADTVVKLNTEHFSKYDIVWEAPTPMGAMYSHYLALASAKQDTAK